MFNQIFSRPSKDQLYMIEFLVHELKIFTDEVAQTSTPFYVSVKFADLPSFIISKEDFATAKENQNDSNTNRKNVQFDIGKTCLFSCRPSELKNWIKEKPLKVEIHKVYKKEPLNISEKTEENPICETKIFLAECLCDFGTIVQNGEEGNFAEPKAAIRNTYNLVDKENNPFGTIRIFLRLSCFGKLIVTRFALQDDSFLFKTGHSLNEFQCIKVPTEEKETDSFIWSAGNEDIDNIKSESDPLNTENILGLSLVCEDLAKTDGGPPVNVPEDAGMNKEAKQNWDCDVTEQKPKPCLSESSCTCVENLNLKNCVRSSSCCEKFDDDSKKHKLFSKLKRMRGGACDPKADNYSVSRSHRYNIDPMKLINCCYCNGFSPKNNFENSSTGVYCFQKCIEEAQEILNSLGNKNGYAGLGILGPAESPYFGRKKINEIEQSDLSSPVGFPNGIPYRDSNLPTGTSYFPEKFRRKEEIFDKHEDIIPRGMPYINLPDTGISTMFQKHENTKFPSKQASHIMLNKRGKRVKRRRKEFGKRKKNFKIKPYNSLATQSTTSKPPIKVSKRIMRHARAMREYNPGIYHGHRNCLDLNMRIPANMGWLWNTCNNPGIPKPRYGWKPGAISKHVYNLLMKAKSESGVGTSGEIPLVKDTSQRKVSKSPKTKSLHSFTPSKQKLVDEAQMKEDEYPPLIQIHRKKGDYFVTINPAKPGDPNAKPLQLKISKNKEEDDDKSDSTGPDFHLGCSPPICPPLKSKVVKTDADTQVKDQDILDAFKPVVPQKQKEPAKGSKAGLQKVNPKAKKITKK